MSEPEKKRNINIELRNIHKSYGSVKASDGVSIAVKEGSIHGILGENGAGKSTLMKIMAGYIKKTSGSVLIKNREVNLKNPAMASGMGVGMLYQEPLDFPGLTVLENFMLGQSNTVVKRALKRLQKNSAKFNFDINPASYVKKLTIGQRQQLEILRLLEKGADVLILDEPTTGISNKQKKTLFRALKKLVSERKSVLLVSHKLEDVHALCDRITVLRRGKVMGNMKRPFDADAIFEMMFKIKRKPFRAPELNPGKVIFEFRNISASGGRTGLENCNVSVRQGEIVGLAGLEGSGQSVFLRVAAGLRRPLTGDVFLRGKKMNGKNFHAFQERGAAFVPTNRLEEGLLPSFSIAEHFILRRKKGFFLKREEAFIHAQKKIDEFLIKGTSKSLANKLSGGNQQRLLLSFLPEKPALLLLEHPTRGLDPESARMVWEQLKKHSLNGSCILFDSSEIDEILMIASRALVFFNGAIIKDAKTRNTDVNEIGRAIAGDLEAHA